MSALFLRGNSRDVLKGLPADYVHCVVTSPPYFGLRRYDGGEEIWGGVKTCLCNRKSGIMSTGGIEDDYVVPNLRESSSTLQEQSQGESGEGLFQELQHQDRIQRRSVASTEPEVQYGGGQHKLEGGYQENTRIYYEVGEGSSPFSSGVCDGAPISNGKASGKISSTYRESSPQERGKERQSARKLRVNGDQSPSGGGDLSLLPKGFFDKVVCPVCGGCQHEWVDGSVRQHSGSSASDKQLSVRGAFHGEMETRHGFCSKCGAWRGQLGAEPTPELYIRHLVEICRDVRRVLRPDGCFFLNIGDSWVGGKGASGGPKPEAQAQRNASGASINRECDNFGTGHGVTRVLDNRVMLREYGMKPLDMVLIPEQLALAARADGWYVRSILIWSKCISGGAWVYARTQKGDMPMMVKEMTRLSPDTVKLWDGEKWNQCVVWARKYAKDCAGSLELELRSGEKIGCTGEHKWPTQRGMVCTNELVIGDVIRKTVLPEPDVVRLPNGLPDEDIGWFVGTYVAEGSQSDGTIQIASNTAEQARYTRLCQIARNYDGYCFQFQKSDNGMTVNINSPVLLGIIKAYVGGRTAKDKHLSPRCWLRSNDFLRSVLLGFLEGDGHYLTKRRGDVWRVNMTRNYSLVRDIRTVCARIGWQARFKSCFSTKDGKNYPSFRGDVISLDGKQMFRNGDDTEVVAIRGSRARQFWSISVLDNPHLFSLASGVLTGNSNPMPESVNGWRWERHKVKVGDNGRGKEAWRVGANDTPQQDHDKDGSFKNSAVWQDCPGCPKCEKNSGYVLRKGSWRATDSYEFVLMLTKTGSYFCDREAVLEPIAPSTIGRGKVSFGGEKGRSYNPDKSDPNFRNGSEQWGREYDYAKSNGNGGRNLRSVLDVPIDLNDAVMRIPTAGSKIKHFAIFPIHLIEPLIKAATSEKGCCPKCGSPWARVIDKGFTAHDGESETQYQEGTNANRLALLRQVARQRGGEYGYETKYVPDATGLPQQGFQRDNSVEAERVVSREEAKLLFPDDERKQQDYVNHIHDHGGLDKGRTIGWLPTCQCGIQETEPCRILDPFSGAGTTSLVCERLGLDSIGIDTSAEYIKLAEARIIEDEQKRIDEQIKQLRREAKLSAKIGG